MSIVVHDTVRNPSESLDGTSNPFPPARQLDHRKHGGVGLGPYITRRLCELYGRHRFCRERSRKGLGFSVRLPTHAGYTGGVSIFID